jgi:hypothetical protein
MDDPMRPIERVTPPPPPPKVSRQRTRDEEQRRHARHDHEPAEDEPDDGLPHVDVRA